MPCLWLGSAPAVLCFPLRRRAPGMESRGDADSAILGVRASLRGLAGSSNFLLTKIEILSVTGR